MSEKQEKNQKICAKGQDTSCRRDTQEKQAY